MAYRIAADAVLIVHLGFIAFVVIGGLAALRFRWAPFVQLPAAAWGAFVELDARVCPLTIWENGLRRLAGESGYATSFVEQYLLPVIYPAGLTQPLQVVLAVGVVLANVFIYGWIYGWVRRGKRKPDRGRPG